MRILFFAFLTSAFYFIQILFIPVTLQYPTFIIFISLLAASVITEMLRIKGRWWSFGIRVDRFAIKNILSGTALGLISIFLVFVILLSLGAKIHYSGFKLDLTYYIVFIFLFIFSAFSEELIFRGIIFQSFIEDNKKYLGALLLSFIFSISHILNPNITFLGLINIFIVGLLMSYMFIESLSLWMPISFHIVWNLLEEIILDSPVSGYRTGINLFNINVKESSELTNFLTGGDFGLEAGFILTIIVLLNFIFVNKLAVYSPNQAANIFKKRYYESTFITNNKMFR